MSDINYKNLDDINYKIWMSDINYKIWTYDVNYKNLYR